MNNILFITRYFGEMMGGTVCSQRNLLSLKEIYDNVSEYKITNKTGYRILTSRIQQICQGYMGGIDYIDIKKIKNIIKKDKCNHVFIDSSLLGALCKIIRKTFPDIKIYTFFHNFEYGYINEIYSGLKKSLYCRWTEKSEQLACSCSDKIIALNKRDASAITDKYQRTPDACIPISIKDTYDSSPIEAKEEYILFIGSYFLPNIEGITWFMNEVLPFVDIKLKIIGRNMDMLDIPKNVKEKVQVLSNVKDLSPFYKEAKAMVMPIFSGSGMKVKTAEALMYGKYILGTKEAFEGYDITPSIGSQCQSSTDFIKQLKENIEAVANFNIDIRNLYLQKYSFNATLTLFKKIL